jgi:hypothetical protein
MHDMSWMPYRMYGNSVTIYYRVLSNVGSQGCTKYVSVQSLCNWTRLLNHYDMEGSGRGLI